MNRWEAVEFRASLFNHYLTLTATTGRETWSGSRGRDGGSTDSVRGVTSQTRTRSTTSSGRRHNAGSAAARTARKERDVTRSLAAAIRQRRPSNNFSVALDSSRLDGDTRRRQYDTSSVTLRLTLGTQRQHARTAERQLVQLRNFNVRHSPSGSHSDNFNVDYYCGYFRSPRNSSATRAQFQIYCVSVINVNRLTDLLRRTFTRRSLKYNYAH